MKKVLLGLFVIAPLLLVSAAKAHEQDAPQSNETRRGQTAPSNPTHGHDSTTLEERLERRKNALQAPPSDADRAAIQAHCHASHAHLRRLGSRILGFTVKREKNYSNLTGRLANLSGQLQAKGLDITEFDKQITELQIKISAFYTALDGYEQAVNDLVAMDCAVDPDGYKATLEDARKLRAEAVQTGQDIRTYLHDTIKSSLQTIRSQVAGDVNTEAVSQ